MITCQESSLLQFNVGVSPAEDLQTGNAILEKLEKEDLALKYALILAASYGFLIGQVRPLLILCARLPAANIHFCFPMELFTSTLRNLQSFHLKNSLALSTLRYPRLRDT